MNPMLIGLVVGIGTAIGLLINFPNARIEGLFVFGAINAVFAIVASTVLLMLASVAIGDERR